ncbi:succinoglycan biosynthesis protein ExoH [Rhizobium mongolense subsp. loessense]|uniref:Succinoglycan biosynthesis protein ExoH n=1 Tax=Rhizobium mongolense subsp. loessense TaxID=158890 RepID=A0A1G4SG54_9HYPH|nr:acyltransferase [Rhizobium mongolense]SCW67309.1 succinoglycan biosynthesis protein ExoH [Rhizobium mongolense subsp. loessense]
MRIVLISGIVFVHIPFDPANTPFNGTYGFFDWLRVFLSEALFRVGVPCLSAISGYLLFRGGTEGFNYVKTVRTKAQTVFLPFLIWNTAFFIAALAMLSVGIGDGYVVSPWTASVRGLLSQLFAAEEFPTNIPLYFLRDLFVCILLSPLLAWLIRRIPLLTLSTLLLLALIPEMSLYIVIKRSILFSFAFGIYASLYRIDIKALDRFAPLGVGLLLAASALLATAIYMTGPSMPDWVELGRNALAIGGAAGFWMLSAPLIKTPLGQRLAKTGSLSFWIFCAHYPLLVLFFMIWGKTGIGFYPLFFCGSLLVLFPVLAVSNSFVRNNAPRLYAVLTGGRTKKSSQSASRRDVPAEFVTQQR